MSLQGGGGGGPPVNPHTLPSLGGMQMGGLQRNGRPVIGRRRTSDVASPAPTESSLVLAHSGVSGGAGSTSQTIMQQQSSTKSVQEAKRNNEKNRRGTENRLITQLFDLLQKNSNNTSTLVKTQKKAVLGDAVKYFQNLQESDTRSVDILSSTKLGSLISEACEGFVMIVRSTGVTHFVSENIQAFLGHRRDEMTNKSIYSIIHEDDKSRFANNLRPSENANTQQLSLNSRNRSFSCRFLSRLPDAEDSTTMPFGAENSSSQGLVVQKSQATFVNMHINGVFDAEENCLLCLALRIPQDASISNAGGVPMDGVPFRKALFSNVPPTLNLMEQFTTRLDLSGKMLGIDTTGLSEACEQLLKQNLPNGCFFQTICDTIEDKEKFNMHLRQTITQKGGQTSAIYALRPASDKPVILVQSKSTRFRYESQSSKAHESDFINAVHYIIRDGNQTNCDEGQPRIAALQQISLPNNQSQVNLSMNASSSIPNQTSSKPAGMPTPTTMSSLVSNDGNNNNNSFGNLGSRSGKLWNLLSQGKSGGNNSNSPSPIPHGAGGTQHNPILKQLLNNPGDTGGSTGGIEVVKHENKLTMVLPRKAEASLDGPPGSKRSKVEASHKAHLAGQNPMLASMLAQTPRPVPSVPTSIANSIVSQIPQDRLPKNLEKKLLPTPAPHPTPGSSTSSSSSTTSTMVLSMGQGNTHVSNLVSASPSPFGGVLDSGTVDPDLSKIIDDVWTLEEELHVAPSPAPATPTGLNQPGTPQPPSPLDAQQSLLNMNPRSNPPPMPMARNLMSPLNAPSPQSSLQNLLASPAPSPRHPMASVANPLIKSPGPPNMIIAQNSLGMGPSAPSPLGPYSQEDHSNPPSVMSIASPPSVQMGGNSPPLMNSSGLVVGQLQQTLIHSQINHCQNQDDALFDLVDLLDMVDERSAQSGIAGGVAGIDAKQAISEIERQLRSPCSSLFSSDDQNSSTPNLPPVNQLHAKLTSGMPQHPLINRPQYQSTPHQQPVLRAQLRAPGVQVLGGGIIGVPSTTGAPGFHHHQQQHHQRQKFLEAQHMRLLANQQNQHIPQQQSIGVPPQHIPQQQQQQQQLQQQQQQQQHQQQQQLISDLVPPPNVSIQPTSPKWLNPRMGKPMPGGQHLLRERQPQTYQQGPLQ